MAEILTESFCERCGTRYTFQSAAPKVGRLAKMKVLSRGFKNYVLSDESSFDEALADARSVDDRETSVEQLDAFHKTFNFCMSCRQYTCQNCWNDREGRCLSCAPSLTVGILPSSLPGLNPVAGMSSLVGNGHVHAEGNGHLDGAAADATAWPDTDLGIAADEISFSGTAEIEEMPVSRLEALFGREAAARIEAGAPKVEESETEITSVPEMIGLEKSDKKQRDPATREPELVGMEAEEAQEPEAETLMTMVADEPDVEDAIATADAEIEVQPEPLLAIATPADETDEPDAEMGATPAPAPEPVPPVHAVDPETDELAAAAAAQTHGLLDKFRARPELAPPTPIASTPVLPTIEMPAPWPAPSPAATPQSQLPYAAIGQQADPTTPQPFGVIGRPQAPSPQPYGAQVAMPYAASAGLPYAAPDGPIQPYPAPAPHHVTTPAMYPPFQSGYAAPQPQPQAQYTAPPAPPSFATPPAYPALQPQYPAPAPPPAPSWRMVAPESPYLAPAPGGPAHSAPVPAAGAEPQWPTTPSWPAPLARGAEAVWAESTRDLLSRPEAGVSACFNCGLPLSATARFCRRCGTSQVAS
jgi:hypothetical protein